jgi:chromosome segregation ATPase
VFDVVEHLPEILAAAGGLAGFGALFRIGPMRRKISAEAEKSGADAAKVLSDTAIDFMKESLDPTRAQIAFLKTELQAANDELRKLREQVSIFDTQLRVAMVDRSTLDQARAEAAALRTQVAGLTDDLRVTREELQRARRQR